MRSFRIRTTRRTEFIEITDQVRVPYRMKG